MRHSSTDDEVTETRLATEAGVRAEEEGNPGGAADDLLRRRLAGAMLTLLLVRQGVNVCWPSRPRAAADEGLLHSDTASIC